MCYTSTIRHPRSRLQRAGKVKFLPGAFNVRASQPVYAFLSAFFRDTRVSFIYIRLDSQGALRVAQVQKLQDGGR